MTITNTRIRMEEKYNSANKLKPVVKKILEENREGLNFNQILNELEKLKEYYKGIKKDLRVLLQSGGFKKDKSKKHRIIYRIQNP